MSDSILSEKNTHSFGDDKPSVERSRSPDDNQDSFSFGSFNFSTMPEKTTTAPKEKDKTVSRMGRGFEEKKDESLFDFDTFDDFVDDFQHEDTLEWEDLDLPQFMQEAFFKNMWYAPLPIQTKVLPMFMAEHERHLVAQAPTGKGKTGAFAILMIVRCDPNILAPQTLCICPTRELAVQTHENISILTEGSTIRVQEILKNMEFDRQITSQIVVATPGSLLRAIKRKKIELDRIKMVVIDEADAMIEADMKKKEERKKKKNDDGKKKGKKKNRNMSSQTSDILEKCPRTVQVMLFSATFSEECLKYSAFVAPDAYRILFQESREQRPVENVKQLIFRCRRKEDRISALMSIYEFMSIGSTLIFVNTKRDVMTVSEQFTKSGHEVCAFHGGLEPAERDRLIKDFREKRATVLVATNVLARGLDVPTVNLVVNYDPPKNYETGKPDSQEFIHRVGRAGRVDRKGMAVMFVYDNRTDETVHELLHTFPTLQYSEIEAGDIEALIKEIKAFNSA